MTSVAFTRTAFGAALLVGALAGTGAVTPARAADDAVTTEFQSTAGKTIGKATLTQLPTGLLIDIAIAPGSLTPGKHGLHLHAVGDCSDAADAFKKAGGHADHSGREHGLANPKGPHMGDLPNLVVAADGSAGAEFLTSLIALRGAHGLIGETGGSIIIHAGPDDHMSQPIGGAGGRVACAVVK